MSQSDPVGPVQRFLEFCRRRQLPRAVIRDIPSMGNMLEALAFEPKQQVTAETLLDELKSHADVQEAIERLMRYYPKGVDGVLAIGSGVCENLLVLNGELQLGAKHMVVVKRLFGGIGVNYTLRLISAGIPVFPVVSMGCDGLGKTIQKFLASEVRAKIGIDPYIEYITDNDFLCPDLETSTSTVIVDRSRRTIFTEGLSGAEHFYDFAKRRMKEATRPAGVNLSVVMIGHILSDAPHVNPDDPGRLTKHVLQEFGGKARIFANLGSSQIASGSRFWADHINAADVFQFSLGEIRDFFADDSDVCSLRDILTWFRERGVTIVITLDRLGAIASFKDGADGLVFAWPFDLEHVVDTTGAGDAFGAGLMSGLLKVTEPHFGDFLEAIKDARVWAAYACGSHGGASETPDLDTLRRFETSLSGRQLESVQTKSPTESELLLKLLDKAYPSG